MKTAVMDRIMRQRNPELKAAVMASLSGEIGKAFDKLGSNVAEVNPDNIAGAVAARWLKLSPEARERTGVMTPSHALRQAVNEHIRERLTREGRITGPELRTLRLVSKGYTRAEKALASNYEAGDVVAFHRPYKRLGVEKGDERRVDRVDQKTRTVHLEGLDGSIVAWKPSEIGGRQGGTEVYRTESMELRAGDRIRWTRNDKSLGVVNSGLAEVLGVRKGAGDVPARGGRDAHAHTGRSAVAPHRPRLVFDRARFPGQDRGQRDRGDGGDAPEADHAEIILRGNLARPGQGGTGNGRCRRTQRTARSGDRGAYFGAGGYR